MNKDIIYSISKDINETYQDLAINGLKISNENRNDLINRLKELIKYETEIYSYLSYDEISEIRKYFDENYTKIGEEISERIINKLDEIIINKYVDEFYLEYEEEEFSEEDKKFDKSSVIYGKTLRRDLLFLKIYFLNRFINNNGFISKDIYINEFIIKQCINTNILTYCSLYPYIENELINNDYKINDYYLNNKLVSQLSLFDRFIDKTFKEDVLKNDFKDALNILLTIYEDNLFENNNILLLIDRLTHVLSVLMLDKDYLVDINKALKINANDFIYYIFYDNFNEINNDKKNIKVLSLNNKF